MNIRTPLRAALIGAGLLLAGGLARAKIERLTLPQIVQKSDGAVVGRIVERSVTKHLGEDGPLYFTTLTIDGRSLVDGTAQRVELRYLGGWISPDEGADNSEAPTADEVRVGNEVVAFHRFEPNMGNGVSGQGLLAWHGGLYQVARARGRAVVQGRGAGYALDRNWELDDLDAEITRLGEER